MDKQESGLESEQREAASKIGRTFTTSINGQILIAVIPRILMYIGYLIIGIHYVFLLICLRYFF